MKPLNIIQPTLHRVLRRITVSKVFWDFVKVELPRLDERRGYRRTLLVPSFRYMA